MKLIKIIIPIIIVAIAVSCDVIPENEYYTPIVNPQQGETKRIALIEDFTGHRCPNCPKAAVETQKLQALYGNSVILMAIHAGHQSNPAPGFTTDYRTPFGTEINDYFQIPSYPKGMVNRVEYDGGRIMDHGEWEAKVIEVIDDEPLVNVRFESIYVHESDSCRVRIAVNTNFVGNTKIESKLCAFITESGMVSAQIDGSTTVEDYVHNHVLRTAFNESGTWGIDLEGIGAETNTFNVTLKPWWVPDNCEIVIYVYDAQTMEILQAATHHVK